MKEVSVSPKQIETLAKVLILKGKLLEHKRIEGLVPSREYRERKNKLEEQLDDLLNGEKEEKQAVNIRIQVGEGEAETKEKKSLTVSLKNLLKGKVADDDDDEVVILRKFFPPEIIEEVGRLVTKL